MRAILFIEIDGKFLFKCDTFWNKSEKIHSAKIYSNNDIASLKGWLYPIIPTYHYTDNESINKWRETNIKYNNAKLGHFIIDDSVCKNQFLLKEEIKIEDLGSPIYLCYLKTKSELEWKLLSIKGDIVDYDPDSIREFIDYKQIKRDSSIDSILE